MLKNPWISKVLGDAMTGPGPLRPVHAATAGIYGNPNENPSFSAAFCLGIGRIQQGAMGGPPPARGHRRLLHNGKCLNSQGFQGFRGCCDRVQRSPQAAPGRVVGKNHEFPRFPEVPAVRVSAPNGRCHLLHNGWCSTAPVH